MKNVKIKLIDEERDSHWLTIEYFPKRRGEEIRHVDQFYLSDDEELATPVRADTARKWMSNAKVLAASDGLVIVKTEYIFRGKSITLASALT